MPRLPAFSPVFLYETIAASRRWQAYALRALLVSGLLASLAFAWDAVGVGDLRPRVDVRQTLAEVAEYFYCGAAGIQLGLALLVAPAASAGSICADRAGGWLTHAFVTELSDAEIVLGKLASRFLSAAGLVLTGVPVFLLAMLLGGIIPEALGMLAAVTMLVLLGGSSFSMAVSARATRSHEVLMAVFGAWAAWLLAAPTWEALARVFQRNGPAAWFIKLNPFVLVYSPYASPGYAGWSDLGVFAAVCLLVTAACVAFAIAGLRREPAPLRGRSARLEAAGAWIRANLASWWPSPSLDGNPVLWREWRRSRPTRIARGVGALFAIVMTVGMGIGLYEMIWLGTGAQSRFVSGTNLIAAMLGLLLLSASAPTSLSEERVRGSLDILLSTTLTTREVVLGKWLAVFRRSLPLLVFPSLAGLFVAATALEPTQAYRLGEPIPLETYEKVLAAILPSAFLLGHAAAVTSLGLAFATWLRRTSRAVAASVSAFLLFSIGWVVVAEIGVRLLVWWWNGRVASDFRDASAALELPLGALSPFGGQVAPLELLDRSWIRDRHLLWGLSLACLLVVYLFAAVVLLLTLLAFDRCMGRAGESRRSGPDAASDGRVGSRAIGLEGNPVSC
ncbi:ABC-2 family transporter protein [Aquisphaera giovannonii]|uniref:ABC-2 family transporter protein n=1 Tax=Aquisphaera giovannonii TaxID=406548 RepID=A0A5B9W2S2_9BACT|nr:ABC transporter permease subunit [Aquisphaera giovannonii]QEH34250.1 ABC-2 family transporter protein [Aquisphaera giovannonii]